VAPENKSDPFGAIRRRRLVGLIIATDNRLPPSIAITEVFPLGETITS
jgi:hypothetical protein